MGHWFQFTQNLIDSSLERHFSSGVNNLSSGYFDQILKKELKNVIGITRILVEKTTNKG